MSFLVVVPALYGCWLTQFSSGRRPASARFAIVLAGADQNNVRRHKSHRSQPMLAAKFHGKLHLLTITRGRGSAHLNMGAKPSVRLGYEPELQTTALLLPDPNPHILGIRRLPAALRSTTSYKTRAGAVSARRQEVQQEPRVGQCQSGLKPWPRHQNPCQSQSSCGRLGGARHRDASQETP